MSITTTTRHGISMGWYSEVSRDLSKISDAVRYYESEILQAKQELRISGSIEQATSKLPGIIENRFNQLQEIEAILEFLNIELRRKRSFYFKKYLETYQRALSSRDAEKYADSEEEIVDYEKIINEFALIRNKWLGVVKAFEAKGFSLNNIIKLRTAGMEDATL